MRVRHDHMRPGWHPDPTRRHEFREWNGHRWTEHVSDGGRASIDPIPSRRKRKAKRRKLDSKEAPAVVSRARTDHAAKEQERLFWGH